MADEGLVKANYPMWSLIVASALLLAVFERLDLLALVVPLSLVIGYGSWLAKRGNVPAGGKIVEVTRNKDGVGSK